MNESADQSEKNPRANIVHDSSSAAPRAHILGLIALVLGIVALALAIVPQVVFDVPAPWQSEQPQQQVGEEQRVVHEGGKSIEWKGFKVTVGGMEKVVEPPPASPPSPPPVAPKAVAIATNVAGLCGLGVGFLAYWRERSKLLALPGIGLSGIALVWPYFLLGVMIGVCIVIVVAMLWAMVG